MKRIFKCEQTFAIMSNDFNVKNMSNFWLFTHQTSIKYTLSSLKHMKEKTLRLFSMGQSFICTSAVCCMIHFGKHDFIFFFIFKQCSLWLWICRFLHVIPSKIRMARKLKSIIFTVIFFFFLLRNLMLCAKSYLMIHVKKWNMEYPDANELIKHGTQIIVLWWIPIKIVFFFNEI